MLDYLRGMDGLDYSDIHIREGKRMALRQAGTIVKTDKWVYRPGYSRSYGGPGTGGTIG